MTRRMYGGRTGDYFASTTGAPVPFATATVWDAREDGSQITALYADDGITPVTEITGDANGGFLFFADDQPAALWIQGSEKRYLVEASDLGDRVETLEATDTAGFDARISALEDSSYTGVKVTTGSDFPGSPSVGDIHIVADLTET